MILGNFAHILVSHTETQDDTLSTRTRTEAKALIQDSLERVREGADFRSIASQVSDCPSGAMGGLLGAVHEGEMVPKFQTVCKTLKVGDVSDIFETEFGYHIVWSYDDTLLTE